MKDEFSMDPESIAHRRMIGDREARWRKAMLFIVMCVLFLFAAAAQQQ